MIVTVKVEPPSSCLERGWCRGRPRSETPCRIPSSATDDGVNNRLNSTRRTSRLKASFVCKFDVVPWNHTDTQGVRHVIQDVLHSRIMRARPTNALTRALNLLMCLAFSSLYEKRQRMNTRPTNDSSIGTTKLTAWAKADLLLAGFSWTSAHSKA